MAKVRKIESAFKGSIVTYSIQVNSIKDPETFLDKVRQQVNDFLCKRLQSGRQFKINFELICTYFNPISDEYKIYNHKSQLKRILNEIDVRKVYEKSAHFLCASETEFQTQRSGWVLISCDELLIRLYKFKPLGGR